MQQQLLQENHVYEGSILEIYNEISKIEHKIQNLTTKKKDFLFPEFLNEIIKLLKFFLFM